ncbi:MAG: formate dehydrogenase family accessory protein FdhD [Pelagibacteraceae bacterium]|nr:formate dehydrogenase family accessory protein FdhD [Pelagibacteraceae bacterium]|tara:strand:- start:767 stop:1576 length:810 start_codon:yes stop_codon:yes gene_type:complete
MKKNKYIIQPNIEDISLYEKVKGLDQEGERISAKVVQERPLTIYLNNQEIVTLMTINDYPEYLAIGYLLNQNMINPNERIRKVEYDKDIQTIVIRTNRKTNYEKLLKKKITTSGCAQGTVFGDIYEEIEKTKIKSKTKIKKIWIYELSKQITLTPSLYLEAGAIHGCVLCKNNSPLIYMEDVGRHNAIDKIAGFIFKNKITTNDKIFYTTGRLTSEMIIKTVKMGIPILISRSGFTAWGVELAMKTNLTLIGRAKGKRFLVLSGHTRIT